MQAKIVYMDDYRPANQPSKFQRDGTSQLKLRLFKIRNKIDKELFRSLQETIEANRKEYDFVMELALLSESLGLAIGNHLTDAELQELLNYINLDGRFL